MIPFYRSSPILMAVAAMTILTVAGCGGDDEARNTGGALPGDSPFTAIPIFPDNGAIVGAIDFSADLAHPIGDVDWYRFQATAGVTYVLQFQGFPVPSPDASDPDFLVITVLGSDASTQVQLSNDALLSLEIFDLSEFRIMFTGQSNGPHYIRVAHARPEVGTGNYVFNLASSQIADGSAPLIRNTKNFTVFNEDGVLVLPTQDVTGEMEIINFNPVTQTVRLRFDTDAVFFVDADGVPEEDPESPELHFHLGVPDNFDISDRNGTPGEPPHPTVLVIPGFGPGRGIDIIQLVPFDLFHILIGHAWYTDVHFTSDLELVPRPVLSSRANGTLTFFQSELPMSGAKVVPPVNTVNALTLLYNSAFQTFMIDYEETGGASPNAPFPADSLVGGAMHVHLTNGQILIDLGVLPPALPLPQFETVPWIKNVVRVLTDEEVWRLRNATYSGGWYVDLHTDAFPSGELRVDAITPLNNFFEIQTNSGGLAPGPN